MAGYMQNGRLFDTSYFDVNNTRVRSLALARQHAFFEDCAAVKTVLALLARGSAYPRQTLRMLCTGTPRKNVVVRVRAVSLSADERLETDAVKRLD